MTQEQINYRRAIRRLRRRYPSIAKQVCAPSMLQVSEIPTLYRRFISISTIADKQEEKLIFIGIIVLMDDPDSFTETLPARKGIARTLASIFGCSRSSVSHSIQTVKNYREIYPEFAARLDYFYAKISGE